MNIKERLQREAQAQGVDFYHSDLGKDGLDVAKAPGKKIYLLSLSESESSKSWLLSEDGIVEYNDPQEAITSFFSLSKTASLPFARKSSHRAYRKAAIKKASITKIAIDLGDSDPWIKDPSQLISKASKELWALTNDGKYLARLFDEDEFPLK